MAKDLSCAETAKLVRKDLKRLFPSVKATVHTKDSTYDQHLLITWWDGPTEEEMKAVCGRYQGYVYGSDHVGEITHEYRGPDRHPTAGWVTYHTGQNSYSRLYSRDFLEPIMKEVAAKYGLREQELHISKYDGSAHVYPDYTNCINGGDDLSVLVYRESRQRSGLGSKPAAPAASETPTATKVEMGGVTGWQVRDTPFAAAKTFQQYKESLGFRWNKDNPKDRFWWCPVDELPADVQALLAPPADSETPAAEPKPTKSPATKFREMADGMQKTIDEKLNPGVAQQNYTARRAAIADGMAADGRYLQKIQALLRALAGGWEQNTLSEHLRGIQTRAQIEALLRYERPPNVDNSAFSGLMKAGLIDSAKYEQARQALLDLLDPNVGKVDEKARRIEELKRNAAAQDIPGFFPTPEEICRQMVQMANIRADDRVLEPSAGDGAIAYAVLDEHPDCALEVVEWNHGLSELLTLQGYKVIGSDIFEVNGNGYDRILMNPPFEYGADILHVRHVYDHCLKPGGRIVAIMSEGVFFRTDSKATEFRAWLEQVNGSDEALPEGTFLKSRKPTGVHTRLVVIDKPNAPRSGKCAICEAEIQQIKHEHEGQPVCDACDSRIVSYTHRVHARLDRMQARADKTMKEAQSDLDRAHEMAQAIPFGQPILVGHHSEKRDRNYRERIHNTYRRGFDKFQKAQRQAERADAAEKNRAISSDNPAAVIELQAKIDRAVKEQELMKAMNASIRKLLRKTSLTPEQRAEALAAEFKIKPQTAAKLFEKDFAGRIGFPDYKLTNNNANIRRMRERLEDLKRQNQRLAEAEEVVTEMETELDGITVERDLLENRIRVRFPGKPSKEIIGIMRECGFVWSKLHGAWQRQLANGEWATERALKLIEPLWENK